MTLAAAKVVILAGCDAAGSGLRAAIEALPDRVFLDLLDPLTRALIYTRLYQLVTLEVVS